MTSPAKRGLSEIAKATITVSILVGAGDLLFEYFV